MSIKRVIIIGEGQTEQRFCREILAPYFVSKNIVLHNPTLKRSGGGMVPWPSLKKQIEGHLRQDRESFVTTMLDYYGINSKHLFPQWDEAKKIADKNARVAMLENAMKSEIAEDLRYKFIPYLQLHEFEGLLFNKIEVFKNNFEAGKANFSALEKIINDYPNPEMINEGAETAPSKRLGKIITGYDKVTDGINLAREIGLGNIRAKSPRFNLWIEALEN